MSLKPLNSIRRVIVFGTGQIGAMVASILESDNSRFEIIGFVDDSVETHETFFAGKPVIGGRDALLDFQGFDAVVNAVGRVEPRRRVGKWLDEHAIPMESAIHPSAIISPGVNIGHGCIIGANTTLYVNPQIGKGVFMGPSVTVSHDTTIGDYALLSVSCTIGARANVEDGAFIGSGATVMPPGWGANNRLQIGANSIIGVGSVVIRDVEANSIVAGVPAKLLRYRND